MGYHDETCRKRAEVEVWDKLLQLKAKQYRAQGLSCEEAEERASADIRREIIGSPRRT